MKKAIFKFGLFLLAGLLPIGCNSDDEEIKGTIIERIDTGKDISTFFNSEWADYTDTYPETFFNREEWDRNHIHLINSQEELKSIYHGSKEIPQIDFSRYSLIIGQQLKVTEIGKKSAGSLKDIRLYDTKDDYRLDLCCTSYIPKGSLLVEHFLYFWGIYPKLNNKNITIQIKLI